MVGVRSPVGGGCDQHCGDVFAWEGIRGIGNEQTCLAGVSTACRLGIGYRGLRTLPTAPSPVTTHCNGGQQKQYLVVVVQRALRPTYLQRLNTWLGHFAIDLCNLLLPSGSFNMGAGNEDGCYKEAAGTDD
jgi:hypothetical protein